MSSFCVCLNRFLLESFRLKEKKMNCYVHPKNEAVGNCTNCGKSICEVCQVEFQGRLVCRNCLALGLGTPLTQVTKDANNAFLIEMLGGFFGFLGIGYLYTGYTNEGLLRLIAWLLYTVIAWVIISLLMVVFVGLLCAPLQLIIQIGVPIWSAYNLKKKILNS